jgi:hypothetical protein
MPTSAPFPLEGGCDCRAIRYKLTATPLIVHCCHCRWCQRESGASYALNAMIESSYVIDVGVDPDIVDTPSQSGRGQRIARCPRCQLAIWSHYSASGPLAKFIRIGTLDNPDALAPDVHIFTASKQPWVVLSPGTPAFAGYYDRKAVWSADSLARLETLRPLIAAFRASVGGAG